MNDKDKDKDKNKDQDQSNFPPQSSSSVFLHLPFSTVLTVLLMLLFVAMIKILAPLLMTLFLSTLLAVSLAPILHWLETKKFPRWLALSILTIGVIGSTVAVTSLVLPKIFQEFSTLLGNLPKFKEELLSRLSQSNPIRSFVEHNLTKQSLAPQLGDFNKLFSAGNLALGGLMEVLLICVFTIYLLIDDGRVLKWVSAFFKAETQNKIKQTSEEVSSIIFSYVAGQFITSVLSFVYVFIALSVLHVPNVLLLATLAGVFDILPVLGFFLAVIPAVLFAVSISAKTALGVVLLYILYHAIENYLIVPAVYGNRLRVSTFVVLVTLIAAGLLAGVEGAIAILPIVASYPVVERIWLRKYVGNSTIAQHAKIES